MARWEATLTATAYLTQQIPAQDLPEVVMVGRSNVGKSTLINSMLERRIAHVSSKPGKTRSLNFYRVSSDPPFCLVDLPGFGFAARAGAELREWQSLVDGYFRIRVSNVLVIHLVDFRHGFLGKDRELQDWLNQVGLPVWVVFTKGDKISRGRSKGMLQKYLKNSFHSIRDPLVTSGTSRLGVEDLKCALEAYLRDRFMA